MPFEAPKCSCNEREVQFTCIQCDEHLFKRCDEKQHFTPKFKLHKRVPYTGSMETVSQCSIHHQPLNLFCNTFSKLICANCSLGEHNSHSKITLQEAVEKAKVSLNSEMKTIGAEIKEVEEEIEEIKKKLEEKKKKLSEKVQKLDEMKLLLSKQDIHPVVFLSTISDLKVNIANNSTTGTIALPHPVQVVSTLLDHVAVWIKKPVKEWKLLYKWTQDEQTNEEWHKKCDNKGPTVTVIRTKGGYIFGGYAHLPWTNSGGLKESKESFIFSLTDGKGRIPTQCLQYQNYHKALYHASDEGPSFGYDMSVRLESTSYFNLGWTYKGPGVYKSTLNQQFLAGSFEIRTFEEIETYLV